MHLLISLSLKLDTIGVHIEQQAKFCTVRSDFAKQ